MGNVTESKRLTHSTLQSKTDSTAESKKLAQASPCVVTTDQASPRQSESNSANDRSNDGLYTCWSTYTNEGHITSPSTEGFLTRGLLDPDSEEGSPSVSSASSHYGAVATTHRGILPFFGERTESEASSRSDYYDDVSKGEPEGSEFGGSEFDGMSYDNDDWSRSGDGDSEEWEDNWQQDLEVNPHLNERFSRVVRSPPMRHSHPLPGQGKRGC
ncbi:hypothetical protein CBS115989_2911 [Aspergillus niger]|nr:hypothetical protein CBS115989_2911 [Aspergillus niger]KAI2847245.1 hypothetical protein CBS11350_3254 [Aspergillus niger]KAI2856985.1 hypothetical protein CBS11232_3420 [Aspergillus niger]KAI2877653.1 hypothetical protein CBS115988_3780 [Aspergillus niger]KAI2889225.1 hypothetical protein CBS11852_6951 [Aspergillus niger]